MNACVIKLDQQRLYTDLPASLVRELLSDVLARYESCFMRCYSTVTGSSHAEQPLG